MIDWEKENPEHLHAFLDNMQCADETMVIPEKEWFEWKDRCRIVAKNVNTGAEGRCFPDLDVRRDKRRVVIVNSDTIGDIKFKFGANGSIMEAELSPKSLSAFLTHNDYKRFCEEYLSFCNITDRRGYYDNGEEEKQAITQEELCESEEQVESWGAFS